MTLPGSNDLEKLHALCDKTYKEQAIWFLNAFWGKHLISFITITFSLTGVLILFFLFFNRGFC